MITASAVLENAIQSSKVKVSITEVMECIGKQGVTPESDSADLYRASKDALARLGIGVNLSAWDFGDVASSAAGLFRTRGL